MDITQEVIEALVAAVGLLMVMAILAPWFQKR
jgi:hypothetical protein